MVVVVFLGFATYLLTRTGGGKRCRVRVMSMTDMLYLLVE